MAAPRSDRLTQPDINEQVEIERIIRDALKEDIGSGDLTSICTVPEHSTARARYLAKADGVLAGLQVAERVFAAIDASVRVEWTQKDGDFVKKGTYFGTVTGPTRAILAGERLSLNIMQRMSGVATATHALTAACEQAVLTRGAAAGQKSHTRVLDTRKTAPCLRVLDKMAHRIGGGCNHRWNLCDMLLIKDNHVTAAGGVSKAVASAVRVLTEQGLLGKVKIELETRTQDEVKEALTLSGVDQLMLDNMVKVDAAGKADCTELVKALDQVRAAGQEGKLLTEASGNININTIAAVAATGVDFVSVGAVTHSVIALDISLKIQNLS